MRGKKDAMQRRESAEECFFFFETRLFNDDDDKYINRYRKNKLKKNPGLRVATSLS